MRNFWPRNLQKKLVYRLGEKPLHDYLIDNGIEAPNETAYTFYGTKITWKELNESTDRLAQFLKNKGIKKNDRVALFMQNCPQYLIGHYAIQKLGVTVVPFNPMYKQSELKYLMNEAEVKGIILSQELYSEVDAIRKQVRSLELIVTTHYTDFIPTKPSLKLPDEFNTKKISFTDTYDLIEILASVSPLTEREKINLWEDVGLLVFTSGTTGRPKGAMITYGNALFKTAATVQANEIKQSAHFLAVAPFCHIAGMLLGVNIPIYSACKNVMLSRFEAETVISAIEKYKINNWYSVAPMNVEILNFPTIENRDLSSLKYNYGTSFGISIDKQLADEWNELTEGGLLFESSYGLSETHSADTFMPRDKIKFGSCGIATYNTEIKIIDPDSGKELPVGNQGEIVIKSPGVFKGYLNQPEATSETLRDGWLYTGDIGKVDEDGYVYFLGRIKEMIKSSGYSVFPEDVEALMKEHEAILQVATIGVPDKTRGETVKAFIVLKPDYVGKISEEEIINWAKDHIAAYKYPREIEFRQSLPATSSGKVLRRLLVEE